MEQEKQWYIVYTNTGSEVKTMNALRKRHIECFCPIDTSATETKYKSITTSLLPNYIFVHISPGEQAAVRQISGVINFMHWIEEHVIVNDEDIFLLKDLIEKYRFINTEKIKVNRAIPACIWETQPVSSSAGTNMEEDCIRVSFPAYGFAITAKESRINIRVININANRVQHKTADVR